MADLIYMAKSKWRELLDTIRTKGGTSASMTADQAIAAVEAIPSGGTRTLQKLAEYTVTEAVSQIDITVTDQMRNCEALYVKLINLTHTEDWLYPVVNDYNIRSGGYGYMSKGTVNNTVLALVPVLTPPIYTPYVAFLGTQMSSNAQRSTSVINQINLKLYNAASVFESGAVEIWGYVA